MEADGIVTRIHHAVTDGDVFAAVEIETVAVAVHLGVDGDALDVDAPAIDHRERPAGGIDELDVFQRDVRAAQETEQHGPVFFGIVRMGEIAALAAAVDFSFSLDPDIGRVLREDQATLLFVAVGILIPKNVRRIVLEVRAARQRGPCLEVQDDIALQEECSGDVVAG